MAFIHDDSPDPRKALVSELSKALGATPALAELLTKALIEAATEYVNDAQQKAEAEVDALHQRLDRIFELCGQRPPGGPPRQTMANRAFQHRTP